MMRIRLPQPASFARLEPCLLLYLLVLSTYLRYAPNVGVETCTYVHSTWIKQ